MPCNCSCTVAAAEHARLTPCVNSLHCPMLACAYCSTCCNLVTLSTAAAPLLQDRPCFPLVLQQAEQGSPCRTATCQLNGS
jgi:hypothetical protein